MNRSLFKTVTLFSYFKEMTSGCETILPVINHSNIKIFIHGTYKITYKDQ